MLELLASIECHRAPQCIILSSAEDHQESFLDSSISQKPPGCCVLWPRRLHELYTRSNSSAIEGEWHVLQAWASY